MTASWILRLAMVVALVAVAGCAQRFEMVRDGAALQGRAGQLYVAGQPDAADLERVAAGGVDIVIDLRGEDETDFDGAAAASAAGLDYLRIPMTGEGPGFDTATIAAVTGIVVANPDADILLHCASGNRVSAWYAIYLVQSEGLTIEQALDRARAMGRLRPELETRVRQYLDEDGDG